jgi:dTDP-4-amino-4,6-dideoxygalactose transaminase
VSNVPLVDLASQHEEIQADFERELGELLKRGDFILGRDVEEFEKAYAGYSGARYCIGVANGTDAIELALRAVGVTAGDEVIVPANTFIATAMAVVRAGARPVIVDCDPIYGLMDSHAAIRAIGPLTKAIIPVHLYGQICYSEPLVAAAQSAGVTIVADAAQAQGARRNGMGVGAYAAVSATSFYPGKNLGAYGDAGAVITDSSVIADKVAALRNYGSRIKYQHPEIGFNSRLDTLQAIVLRLKLSRLDDWNQRRRRAAEFYSELLADLPEAGVPKVQPGNEHVFHLYTVSVPGRDNVLERLRMAGIGAGVHYPIPVHLQKAFRYLGHFTGDFAVAEALAQTTLSLPLYPHITRVQQHQVVEALRFALAAGGKQR